jgi:DNA-binding NarL/FixJ family response regulator
MAEPAGVEKGIGVRVLALCGESVLIEGIEAGLQDRQGVEIVRLEASQPDAIQALDKLSPDFIVFDLTPIQLSCVFTFLRTHPDVVLIGLDIDFDRVLFLSGEWRMLPTVADLMQVIEERIQMKNGKRLCGKEDLL